MQELAIILSSIAGAATAVAVKKFPKNKQDLVSLGATSQIKNQINSLKMEKEILTKTISRLHQQPDPGLSKITRDKLLLRYQHQLGVILAKIDKLEAASKHPDLGPVGEGLITLMDQKLSKLDQRLYDLSAKINLATISLQEAKVEQKPKEKPKPAEIKKEVKPKEEEETTSPHKEQELPPKEITVQATPKQFKPVEITTLTEIPKKAPTEFPLIENQEIIAPQEKLKEEILKPKEDEKLETISVSVASQTVTEPQIIPEKQEIPLLPRQETIPKLEEKVPKPEENVPKPKVNLPDDEFDEDDMDDELDKIKGELMKTLSKLEQVEVE